MSKTPPPQPTLEEKAAAALNEQGYLLAQAVRERIRSGGAGAGQPVAAWRYLTNEYAITAADASQTRIDLVLKGDGGNYVCVECKRAHPAYKQWIFFDRELGPGGTSVTDIFFESFRCSGGVPGRREGQHLMWKYQSKLPCRVFNLYLEVATDRQNRSSYTQTIEDACMQATLGQSGLVAKLRSFQGDWNIVVFPVVVTTAQLFEACFDVANVRLASGTVEAKDLKLDAIEFCAVNYHANDNLAVSVDKSFMTIEHDILWQTRTVFVVQAERINVFLNWLDANIVQK